MNEACRRPRRQGWHSIAKWPCYNESPFIDCASADLRTGPRGKPREHRAVGNRLTISNRQGTKLRPRRGVNLVEVLVVIAIVAILIALAVAGHSGGA